MTEKNIQMQKKNADGSFDVYYPKTKAANVIAADGSTVESHLADMATFKSETEVEIDSLKQSVSSGKSLLETTITDKGGTVSKENSIATFNELSEGVNGIKVGEYSKGDTIHVSKTNTKQGSIVKVHNGYTLPAYSFATGVVPTDNNYYIFNSSLWHKILKTNNAVALEKSFLNLNWYREGKDFIYAPNGLVLYRFSKTDFSDVVAINSFTPLDCDYDFTNDKLLALNATQLRLCSPTGVTEWSRVLPTGYTMRKCCVHKDFYLVLAHNTSINQHELFKIAKDNSSIVIMSIFVPKAISTFSSVRLATESDFIYISATLSLLIYNIDGSIHQERVLDGNVFHYTRDIQNDRVFFQSTSSLSFFKDGELNAYSLGLVNPKFRNDGVGVYVITNDYAGTVYKFDETITLI